MERERYLSKIAARFEVQPVVALLGPRQCGKTTLARMYADRLAGTEVTRFDLEDPTDLAALAEPKLILQGLRGLVIIDEIQRVPELFPILRVLVDRPANPARFLILGSASRDLIRQSSETLAGRIGHLELTPFQLGETGAESLQRIWMRGGFPRSFLAASEDASRQWRKDYVAVFLDRDLPALGNRYAEARSTHRGLPWRAPPAAGRECRGHRAGRARPARRRAMTGTDRMPPLVSVCIANYNGLGLIDTCIESVRRLPLHLALLLIEGMLLSPLRLDFAYLARIYLPVYVGLARWFMELRAERRQAMASLRLARTRFFGVFNPLPYKLRMVMRYGLPRVH